MSLQLEQLSSDMSVSSARAALLLASLAGLATARIGGDGHVAREEAKAPYKGQCCLSYPRRPFSVCALFLDHNFPF
jgi:hypothetical protein